jgi:hypothetical protein
MEFAYCHQHTGKIAIKRAIVKILKLWFRGIVLNASEKLSGGNRVDSMVHDESCGGTHLASHMFS